MEDMDEYHRCLDEIGKCNHIMALDELSDNQSQVQNKQEDLTNDKKANLADSQDKQNELAETTGDNITGGSAVVTNFLKDTNEFNAELQDNLNPKDNTERATKWENLEGLNGVP